MSGFHVFTRGGECDGRRRWSHGRRVSSGATLCGAPVDGETLGRQSGAAHLRLPDWRARLCPECLKRLEKAAARRQPVATGEVVERSKKSEKDS